MVLPLLGEGFQPGLPVVNWVAFQPGPMRDLVIPALNLALVSFVSLMLTARSFAAKNGYEINADAEFRALGIANIMSGLSQGFAISGADGPRLMIPLEEKVSWYPLSQP
jgi:MFS superfamily sulfate permease-like transporter